MVVSGPWWHPSPLHALEDTAAQVRRGLLAVLNLLMALLFGAVFAALATHFFLLARIWCLRSQACMAVAMLEIMKGVARRLDASTLYSRESRW